MTADEIMHVLRLTAMGRVNHPDQQRLCEALEKVLAAPDAAVIVPMEQSPITDAAEVVPVVKRGPGRPKKAE